MSMTKSSLKTQQELNNDIKEYIKSYSFYILIDPYTGIGCGKSLLKLETQKICFMLESEGDSQIANAKEKKFRYDIHLNFCNIYDQKSLQSIFKNLKTSMTEKFRKNRIIVCGNESSLNDIICKAEINNIPIDKIPIGIIPSGTNNDLSNVLGWGNIENVELVDLQLKFLKGLARKWVRAIIEKIDTWKVEIQVNEEQGEIEKVNKISQLKSVQGEKTISQYMISNLNIGIHARIALGFNQKRSNESSFANKFIYAYQGLKKMMCMKPVKIQKTLAMISIHTQSRGNEVVYKTLFSAKKMTQEKKNQEQQLHAIIPETTLSLACLNINCYKGVTDLWKNAKTQNPQQILPESQSYYDGKLDFISFDSTLSFEPKRICQAQGNIVMKMQRHYPTYLQVDSISYKLSSPKEIKITKHKKLQIMINRDDLRQY